MTRTRSEVKTSLTQCSDRMVVCDGCAYGVTAGSACIIELTRDALEYIMELETEIKQLKEVPPNGNA